LSDARDSRAERAVGHSVMEFHRELSEPISSRRVRRNDFVMLTLRRLAWLVSSQESPHEKFGNAARWMAQIDRWRVSDAEVREELRRLRDLLETLAIVCGHIHRVQTGRLPSHIVPLRCCVNSTARRLG
jgi:hypothetical protein